MSPARRWPPPHRPQGCSFCPWFFSWTSGFSCYKLSQVGHTCRIIWRGRNWATARGVPVVGQRLWLLFPGLCTFPLPGDPSGIAAGAPLVLSCLPCAPPAHGHPLWGQCTPVPRVGGKRDGSSRCHFCHPLSLSCPFLARGSGWGWDGAAEQRSPQLSLGPVDFLARKVGSSPSSASAGPQLRAGLCCSVPVPAAPGS